MTSIYLEFKTEPVHFLQIWIVPDTRSLAPGYDQRPVNQDAARHSFTTLATKDGRDGSIRIRQDVDLLLALVEAGERRSFSLRPGRHAWIHVARGSVVVNQIELADGDGLGVSDERSLNIGAKTPAEVLLFDLA